jgi:hypothetical protein
MVKFFIILSISWFGGRFIYGVDFAKLYEFAVNVSSQNQWLLVSCGTIGSLFFIFVAFILSESGLFSLLHALSKLCFELSQFVICSLSFFAVIFFYQLQMNLWWDLGILALIPFEILAASCFSLYLFDFNYPLGEKLLNNIVAPIVSGLIVIISKFAL